MSKLNKKTNNPKINKSILLKQPLVLFNERKYKIINNMPFKGIPKGLTMAVKNKNELKIPPPNLDLLPIRALICPFQKDNIAVENAYIIYKDGTFYKLKLVIRSYYNTEKRFLNLCIRVGGKYTFVEFLLNKNTECVGSYITHEVSSDIHHSVISKINKE